MVPDHAYKTWIKELKDTIRTAQIKASLSVNAQLITLYWDMGRMIVEKQQLSKWGSGLIPLMAKDLKRELPDTSGFSQANLYNMRQFYLFYQQNEILQQLVGKMDHEAELSTKTEQNLIFHQPGGKSEIVPDLLLQVPWGHHVVIISKCDTSPKVLFYLRKIIENSWSRNVLQLQIEGQLYERQGKAINNFELTLPKPQSDLAKETLKDPYVFDFLTLEESVQELELERRLTENITRFLLELGKGFAYLGRQYPIQIGGRERRLDLFFYHTRMHCYVVIDLKMGEFEPEYAGKMNYYLSAVDDLLKSADDHPSIGIILCKTKNSIDVEYALRDIRKPMGISEFTFNELPDNIKQNMPTVTEMENELKNIITE